jgi:phytanoyl-CoA hydroxylase
MQSHPLNREFEWQDHSGPYRLISDAQAKQYDGQGFFVYEGAFDEETLSALIREIDPIEEKFADILREKAGGKLFIARADEITFTPHIVTRSAVAREFTRSAFFRDLNHDLLGPDVRLYWDQSVYKKPGTVDVFPWHQDNGYTYVEPQHYLTCWVALTDADEENGCPMVLPGVHRRGTLAHAMTELGWDCVGDDDVAPIATPVRAGDVVVFSSLTPHLTVPNRSVDRIRKTYIVQFAPDGAELLEPKQDGYKRVTCDEASRQYWIVKGGEAPEYEDA